VHVAKYMIDEAIETNYFRGVHSANLKLIYQMESDSAPGVGLYSIDTGNNGNLLQNHYFTMNNDHLSGNLHPMVS
jgi:hypothetical protein